MCHEEDQSSGRLIPLRLIASWLDWSPRKLRYALYTDRIPLRPVRLNRYIYFSEKDSIQWIKLHHPQCVKRIPVDLRQSDD